jgi:hypothetical protein
VTLVLPVRTFAPKRIRAFFDRWAGLALGWTSTGAAASTTRRVHQADGGDPRPALPYFSYTRMTGPSAIAGAQDTVWIGDVPTSATITVTTSTVGDWTTVVINEARFSRQLLAGETTTDQRDALLALIQASIEPVTATASGASAIALVPEYPGDLQYVTAVEGCTASTVLDIRQVVRGQRAWRYRVQLHAGSDGSDSGSGWIDIDQCADALLTVLWSPQMTAIASTLQVQRFGPRPTPQRASVNSGGRIEQRSAFDVNLSMITRFVSTSSPIGVDEVDPPAIVLT